MKVEKRISIHYKWGDDCDGWKMLDRENLSVIVEKMPPGASETLHRHKTATQFFYILKGAAEFEIEGEKLTVAADEGIEIEPLQNHKISNESEDDLEFIVISQPTTKAGDRFE
jgi:mannose-6-phosphate isomerase-like protein (cupin superfamily)